MLALFRLCAIQKIKKYLIERETDQAFAKYLQGSFCAVMPAWSL